MIAWDVQITNKKSLIFHLFLFTWNFQLKALKQSQNFYLHCCQHYLFSWSFAYKTLHALRTNYYNACTKLCYYIGGWEGTKEREVQGCVYSCLLFQKITFNDDSNECCFAATTFAYLISFLYILPNLYVYKMTEENRKQ